MADAQPMAERRTAHSMRISAIDVNLAMLTVADRPRIGPRFDSWNLGLAQRGELTATIADRVERAVGVPSRVTK